MKSYLGLVLGFGLLGGIGMGLGYAAATPAALKWFGPHQRGLIVGLVVAGYGGAAIYISPLAKYFISHYGISGSFIGLGLMFAVVIVLAAQLLRPPEAGYVPPAAPPTGTAASNRAVMTAVDWSPGAMLKTWQFYGLVFLFIGSAQSGLLVIANATPILNKTAQASAFLAANAWLLASYGGLINATGRVGTGLYSDRVGRANAYLLNGVISAICLFLMPSIMRSGSPVLLFLAVGIAYWQYGGGLSLMPAMTADFFGANNLGLKYGLVFIGWGIAFFVPQLAGYIKDTTGSLGQCLLPFRHAAGGRRGPEPVAQPPFAGLGNPKRRRDGRNSAASADDSRRRRLAKTSYCGLGSFRVFALSRFRDSCLGALCVLLCEVTQRIRHAVG